MKRNISDSTVRRLSLYLRILEDFEAEGVATVSSEDLASRGDTTAAQVRKDLSLFGSFGKRGLGYSVSPLADELRQILGLTRAWRVTLVGAGRIGSALFEYRDFRQRGFEIVAVVDTDPQKVGATWGDVVIRHGNQLEDVLKETRTEILILAVPANRAQEVLDRAVAAGVMGVLNFAPTRLSLPDGVVFQDVNMVMELEAISFGLANKS